jgi:hypothetical protein
MATNNDSPPATLCFRGGGYNQEAGAGGNHEAVDRSMLQLENVATHSLQTLALQRARRRRLVEGQKSEK